MKLKKILRKLMWIFLAAFLACLFGVPIAESFYHNFNPDPNNLPFPVAVLAYAALSFLFLMIVSMIGFFAVMPINNAIIRRSGLPATARVLAIRQTGEYNNNEPVCRYKLEVHPADGAPFEAVAEDVIPYSQLAIMDGATVSVRYNPRTKDVAFEKPKKSKEDDF